MTSPEDAAAANGAESRRRPSNHGHALFEVRNWELLIAALVLVLIYVLRHTGLVFGTAVDVVNEGLFAIVMFLVMARAGSSRRMWIIQGTVAGAAVALSFLGLVLENDTLTTLANFLGIYIIGFTVVLLLWVTLRRQRVTGDTLFGAVSIYLSIGIVFGIVYTEIARSSPAAFDPAQVISNGKSELYYFSFVTLTALGYGDIAPVSDLAQILATLEAILGVILLVALVGRIVALLVAQGPSDGDE